MPVPSLVYFDLSTWHRINLLYAPKALGMLRELRSFFVDEAPYHRLMRVIDRRLGHELLGRTEAAKIALSDARVRRARPRRRRAATWRSRCGRTSCSRCCADLLARLVELGRGTVAAAGLAPDRIGTLYFTGGSSGMAALREAFEAAFPAKPHRGGRSLRQRRERARHRGAPALRDDAATARNCARVRRSGATRRLRSSE